jgi:hypothetical protein
MPIDDYDFQERVAIMETEGKMSHADALRLATERPWDKDPYWGMPRPQQQTLIETEGDRFFSEMNARYR